MYNFGFNDWNSSIFYFPRVISEKQENFMPSEIPYNLLYNDEKNQYIIEIDVVGIPKEEINVFTKNNVLTIDIKYDIMKNKETEYKILYHGLNTLKRNFKLSFSIDECVVESANTVNGVLKIVLNKVLLDENEIKKIPINNN